MCRNNAGSRKGFTLVELAVVIVIIGVLAAFGVPQFLKSVERSKAAEAFNYLAAVRAAQERYLAKEGIYATNLTDLDIVQTAPKYFNNPTVMDTGFPTSDGGSPHWQLTLTRNSTSSSYGGYTVTFAETGYDKSTAAGTVGAYPDINPMGSN
ncbi:MAG: prepilin-type N-terminal cleavage/methylation domain-containing protein [Thermoguttaceae bacterium]